MFSERSAITPGLPFSYYCKRLFRHLIPATATTPEPSSQTAPGMGTEVFNSTASILSRRPLNTLKKINYSRSDFKLNPLSFAIFSPRLTEMLMAGCVIPIFFARRSGGGPFTFLYLKGLNCCFLNVKIQRAHFF